jgi:hypothetical protein
VNCPKQFFLKQLPILATQKQAQLKLINWPHILGMDRNTLAVVVHDNPVDLQTIRSNRSCTR